MSLVIKDGGEKKVTQRKLIPMGSHVAICDQVVDLGLQRPPAIHPDWPTQPKVWLRWQIPSLMIDYKDADGEDQTGPMVLGRVLSLTFSELGHLRPLLESWRGQAFTDEELRDGFDIRKVLGKPCLISVVHGKGKKKDTDTGEFIMYSNVGGVMALPKGMEKPQLHGQVLLYDEENPDAYDRLPKFLQDMVDKQVQTGSIEDQPQSKAGEHSVPDDSNAPGPEPAMEDDDIPF